MRINIKFIYLLLGIGIVYFTDSLFLSVIVGKDSELQLPVTRVVWIVTFLGSLYLVNYMSSFMRTWCIASALIFLYFILESLYLYGSFFQFPRVFSKVLEIFSIFYVYGFYKKFNGKINVENVVHFIAIFFILNAAIVNRTAFSVVSFAEHDRGFTAESVYFLVIPILYFFNKYFSDKSAKYLFYGGFFLFIVIFLQHRTVWIATSVALFINFLMYRKSGLKIDLSAFIPIALIVFVAAFFVGFFILTNETIVTKLNESIDDLANPTGQGTGSWRWEQFTSYWPFIVDNFLFGMRLQGFELPVQFFDRDNLAFEDGTGHHFHSYYVDRLFYFGITGLLFIMAPVIYYITFLVGKIKKLGLDRIAFLGFVGSAIVYSLSYKIQLNVYASVGFFIYIIETDFLNQQKAEFLEKEEEETHIDEEVVENDVLISPRL
ncbi:O-antigen ligase family protein [Chondrinema litorale]|uniref:O-antigen ligase family protein n=1 Tax=Chondrinema litorale TaxID=2994555 RepID=UPI0025428870|nr:O-antigen ligase family protein [Chondrinema litorale]UZR93204.1 O-antigen ligase family protein [Chondrinema litorale]